MFIGHYALAFAAKKSAPTLSLGTDLGMGQPMEHVLRQSLIALRLSDRIGLDDQLRLRGRPGGVRGR